MNPSLPSRRRRPASAGARLKSIAAAALLLGAGAAQAALVINASSATLNADTSASGEELVIEPDTNGRIDKTVLSKVFLDTGDGAQAKATVDSAALPTQLFATAEAELLLTDGVTGAASVNYVVFFSVIGKTRLTGLVGFRSTGVADLLGTFDLFAGGPGDTSILSASAASPDIDVLLTLEPGEYSIVAHTGAIDLTDTPGQSAIAFAFNLLATDVVDPPAAVPEPASLALALAGLLATGRGQRVRRRRGRNHGSLTPDAWPTTC